MNRQSRYFIALLATIAFAIIVAMWPFTSLTEASQAQLIALVVLSLISFTSEAFYIYTGQAAHQTSVAFVPFLACMVLFPPSAAVPAVTISVLLSNIFPHRRSFWKLLYNVSQTVIASACASFIFHALNSSPGGADPIPFTALAIVFFSINAAALAVVVSLMQGRQFTSVLSEVVGPKGTTLLRSLLASPMALLIVTFYAQYKYFGIAIVLVPVLLIQYSYSDRSQLKRANKDLIMVLIKAIETRDPYTSGHSLRVATLAKLIAQDLRLPVWRVEQIEMAALLHDVGKIDPSFEVVIRKPYDLTAEERALIQTHAALGADLLRNLQSVPDYIIAAVRHHHERMDGKGYPDGISGNEIPLPARIIMLCDSVDAMLSDRPYRKALSLDRVRQELIKCSGDQFDPDIVKVVLQRDTLSRAANLVNTISDVEQQYLIKARA